MRNIEFDKEVIANYFGYSTFEQFKVREKSKNCKGTIGEAILNIMDELENKQNPFDITTEQLEVIFKYLSIYLKIPSQKTLGIQSYKAYLKKVVIAGIRKMLEARVILDLEEITVEILRDENILIPVTILKRINEGDI